MTNLTYGQPSFIAFEEASIDTNSTSSVSATFSISGYSKVAFQVIGLTGTHTIHVVTLQCSLDNTNWTDSAHSQMGQGTLEVDSIVSPYVRFKVTTAELTPSTSKILAVAK